MSPAPAASSTSTPPSATHVTSAPSTPSTSTSSATAKPVSAAAAVTPATKLPIITIGRRVLQDIAPAFQSADNLSVNVNGSSVDISNAGASTTSLATVTTAATTYPPDANATPALGSARRVRGDSTHPGAVMAIIGLLFIPTLTLMLGPTLMSRGAIGSVPNPITNAASSFIFFVTLIFEIVAATVEAFSTSFPAVPDTETHDPSSTIDWGERMGLIARYLAVVVVVLFLVGVGSLALEYSLPGTGSAAEVNPLVK